MPTPSLEIVQEYAEEYRDRLVWIEDIKSFAMFDIEKEYYEILSMDEMIYKMSKYVLEKENKSYADSHIRHAYLSYLIFEIPNRIPSVFCPELWYYNRYNYIAFQDKLLNLDDFKLSDKGKDKFVFHYIHFSYEEIKNSEAPMWHKFLDEVLIHEEDFSKPDEELKTLLKQMFGYCLANTIKAQKAFFMFGASRAGKGVITSILHTIMGGGKFVANNKLQTLRPNDFTLSNLVGKKANIAGEEESSIISADTFKELVAGDIITAQRKFESHFSFAPQIKLIMSSNKPLKFKYIDTAIRERLITIPFFRHFQEHERDFDLTKKLHKEIPGILKWALEGLEELMAQDWKFKIPQASKKAMQMIEEDVSNVLKFFNENYEESVDDKHFTTSDDLYTSYRSWCVNNGYKGIMTNSNFYKELNNSINGFIKSKIRKTLDDGTRPYGYNLKLKDDGWVRSNSGLFN